MTSKEIRAWAHRTGMCMLCYPEQNPNMGSGSPVCIDHGVLQELARDRNRRKNLRNGLTVMGTVRKKPKRKKLGG